MQGKIPHICIFQGINLFLHIIRYIPGIVLVYLNFLFSDSMFSFRLSPFTYYVNWCIARHAICMYHTAYPLTGAIKKSTACFVEAGYIRRLFICKKSVDIFVLKLRKRCFLALFRSKGVRGSTDFFASGKQFIIRRNISFNLRQNWSHYHLK